jgi:O-antigen/teichoic acid export membrane protein
MLSKSNNIIALVRTLLFSNKSVKQTLVKNAMWLTAAEILDRVLKFVLVVYTVRILGPNGYGMYAFAFSVASLILIIADMGLVSITTREFSGSTETEKDFPDILSLRLVLSVITVAVAFIISQFITDNLQTRMLILFLSVFVVLYYANDLLYALIRARMKMEYEAIGRILVSVSLTMSGLIVLKYIPSAENIALAYMMVSLFFFLSFIVIFHFKVIKINIRTNMALWKKYLSMSWPLALTFLCVSMYSYIDSVMMGALGQVEATGYFNASYRIIFVTLMPMSLITRCFFPLLSERLANHSIDKIQHVWNYYAAAMIFMAIPLVVGGLATSTNLIDMIYGGAFSPAATVFSIMIFVTGIAFLAEPFNQTLIIYNKQKKTFIVTLIGAAVNIVLNIILVPKYSLFGAASATVSTYAIMCVLYVLMAKRHTDIRVQFGSLATLIIAAFIMSLPMLYVLKVMQQYGINIMLAIASGAAVYLLELYLAYLFKDHYWQWIFIRKEEVTL